MKRKTSKRSVPAKTVFLFDVENTLLDNDRITADLKNIWGRRVTTVFVRQGHYALDPKILATYPAADVSIEHIGDLLDHDLAYLTPRTAKGASDSLIS